jgi:hypothetical protein
MRAHRIGVPPPALADDPRLARRGDDLAIEQRVAPPGTERLGAAVLPGRARGNAGRRDAGGRDQACTEVAANPGPLSARM